MNCDEIYLPYTIKENGCVLEGHIGRGTYGNVYRASKNDKGKNMRFAFKEYKTVKEKNHYDDDDDNYAIGIFESILLESLHHPNILKSFGSLFSIVQNETKLFISMQLISPIKEKLYTATEDSLEMWCAEFISGMFYMETKGLCHGDIKPENLGINKKGNLIIYDFSLTFFIYKPSVCSTFHYRSPKFLLKYLKDPKNAENKNYFNGATQKDYLDCNMWSFGITTLCIISRKNDFIELLEAFRNKNVKNNEDCLEILHWFYKIFCLEKDKNKKIQIIKKISNFESYNKKNHIHNIIHDLVNFCFDTENEESNKKGESERKKITTDDFKVNEESNKKGESEGKKGTTDNFKVNEESNKKGESEGKKVTTGDFKVNGVDTRNEGTKVTKVIQHFSNLVKHGKFFLRYTKLKDTQEFTFLFENEKKLNENCICKNRNGEYMLYVRFLYHFLVDTQSVVLFPILFEMANINANLIEQMKSDPTELTSLFLTILCNITYLNDKEYRYFLNKLKVNPIWLKKTYFDFYNRCDHSLWVRSIYDDDYLEELLNNSCNLISGML